MQQYGDSVRWKNIYTDEEWCIDIFNICKDSYLRISNFKDNHFVEELVLSAENFRNGSKIEKIMEVLSGDK